MFLGALYPSGGNERGASTRRKQKQDAVSSASASATPNRPTATATTAARTTTARQPNAPCVGVVDCRQAPDPRTGLAPIALLPAPTTTTTFSSSAPGATARLNANGTAPAANTANARSHSIVSAAAVAAVGPQNGCETRGTWQDAVTSLPPIHSHKENNTSGQRERTGTIDWARREVDMEDLESRLQIAALPDPSGASSDDDDDDDDTTSSVSEDWYTGEDPHDSADRLLGFASAASPRTTASRQLVMDVLAPSLASAAASGAGVPSNSSKARGADADAAAEAVHRHSRAHPLWRFQASLLLSRRTRLYTDVFAPYCRTHTRMQLVLSKADYIWDVLLAEEGLRGSLLQSAWEERSRTTHPLVWLMSTRDVRQRLPSSSTTPRTSTAAAPPAASHGGGLTRVAESAPRWRTGDGAVDRATLTSPALARGLTSPTEGRRGTQVRRKRRASNCYDDVAAGTFSVDSVCLRLLSEHMAQAKPSIPALLDNAYALLSQPPLKPLYEDELSRILHVLAHELTRQAAVMEKALARLEQFARVKERHGNARTWLLTLLRLCQEAAEDTSQDSTTTTTAAEMTTTTTTAPFHASSREEAREPWAPSSVALQEPSHDDVQVWYRLVETLHTTGVASLKPEHVLDALAAALSPFAAPALLTVQTPSLVYGTQQAPASSAAGTSGRPTARPSHATANHTDTTNTSTMAIAGGGQSLPDVREVDLALALFSLHALGADPSVFAQRDVTYSLQEVTTLIQCACLLCESRRGEDDSYLESTVRFATTVTTQNNNSSICGEAAALGGDSKMREEVGALLEQLWEIGVFEVSSHFLRQMMREQAPLFQDALRRVHQTYTTGKPPRPELEVALAATFLKGCYSVLPSPPAGAAAAKRAQDTEKHSGGGGGLVHALPQQTTGPAATASAANGPEYGSAQRVRQEVGRRLRNAYICSNVQRRFSNSFYLTAVCHESVAQLREQAVIVLWELFAPPARQRSSRRQRSSGGCGGATTGDPNFFLLSTRGTDTQATSRKAAEKRESSGTGAALLMRDGAFSPQLRRASAALTPGYHLNDRVNPLLLPNAPPPEDTLRWLERRVQQRNAPRTTLPLPVNGLDDGAEADDNNNNTRSGLPLTQPQMRDMSQERLQRVEAPLLLSSPAVRGRGGRVPAASELYDSGLVMDIFKVPNKYRQLHGAPEVL